MLSAIITAFVITAEDDIKSSPADTTNSLLLSLLQNFDPAAAQEVASQKDDSRGTTVRICAWWYASLLFSLLSSFTGLLAKQWISHYNTQADWAETIPMQCRVRELRFQGLRRWRFYYIMETVSILLQIALFLFTLGLVEYLRSSSLILSYIALTFLIIGLSFFGFTIVTGIFFNSCPFKSPLTEFLYESFTVIAAWGRCAVLAAKVLVNQTNRLVDAKARRLKKLEVELWHTWRQLHDRDVVGGFERDFGEKKHVEKDFRNEADVGVFSWALQLGDEYANIRDAAARVVLGFSASQAQKAVEVFRVGGMFDNWSEEVSSRILQGDDPTPSTSLLGDVLFHLMYHSPTAHRIASDHVLPDQRKGGIWADGNNLVHYIRQASTVNDTVDIKTFPPSKLVLYVEASLCLSAIPGWKTPWYLEADLRTLFQSEAAIRTIGIEKAVCLSAMVLVDRVEERPQTLEGLQLDPIDGVLRAMDRLSFYESDTNDEILFVSTIQWIYTYFNPDELSSKYHLEKARRTPYWKTGKLVPAVIRLLRLSYMWSNNTLRGPCVSLATRFILETGTVAHLPGVFQFVEEEGMDAVFSLFSRHFDPEEAEMTLALLDVALGLRRHRLRSKLPRLIRVNIRTRWVAPSAAQAALLEHPDVVSGMLKVLDKDPEARVYVLSALVKGRDVFFPDLNNRNPGLSKVLESLGGGILLSNDIYDPLSGGDLDTFEHWPAVKEELVKQQVKPYNAEKPAADENYTPFHDPAPTDALPPSSPPQPTFQHHPPTSFTYPDEFIESQSQPQTPTIPPDSALYSQQQFSVPHTIQTVLSIRSEGNDPPLSPVYYSPTSETIRGSAVLDEHDRTEEGSVP